MSTIKLLDCTLRDGGYINDWEFGAYPQKDIIKKLVESNVDYVEVGFLRDCMYDEDYSLFNNCEEISHVLPSNKGRTIFTAMALHNKYDVSKLEPYDGKTIDAVRVTFHDYDIDEGLQFMSKVKEKGYKVFCNPINIMGYSDEMLLDLIKKVNILNPYAFSIVDTFGSMMKEDLQRIYSLLEHNLNHNIVIGLHLHENLGLAYSLAQEFVSMKATDRECIIDGSMLGMGRVPGNLCIELIMDYLNRSQCAEYEVNPVLDAIDDYIEVIKQRSPWGYNTAYALSAKYNLHRNYAEFLLGKGRLRAKHINQILAAVEDNKKTAFDEAYIQSLYEMYQNRTVDDTQLINNLKMELSDKDIVVLAPGRSIVEYKKEIEDHISRCSSVVISANFIPNLYKVNYAFFSNAVRFGAVENDTDVDMLITSNLLENTTGNLSDIKVVNYSDVSVGDRGNTDNCVIMLLRLLIRIGCGRVSIAGFDGYSNSGEDYISGYLKSYHTKGEEENNINSLLLSDIIKKMEVNFITPSRYLA